MKFTCADEMQEIYGAQNQSSHIVHKDLSTKIEQQFAAKVEFPKKSNDEVL